jgi:hypothetical protein
MSASLRRHDIRSKFHENKFGLSGNNKVIILIISEAAVLVILLGSIYDVCC